MGEEDYNLSGGNILSVSYQNNLSNIISTVIGEINEDNSFGKDFNNEILFVEEDGGFHDLDTLTNKQTITQTLETILHTFQGSIPEYPQIGITKGILGGNVNSFQYPILLRNIGDLISLDDAFSSYTVNEIKLMEGEVYLDIVVSLKNNTTLEKKLIM